MQEENNAPPNDDTISQIFDKILKRILLSLSGASIVAFINGMFSESFPLDSEITYNYTENLDSKLKRTVADIIITLKTKDRIRRFHLEGQINDDNTIVIRVFEYGFADALRHQTVHNNKISLPFPTPVIIFLEHTDTTPDEVILELDFGKSGKFDYTVKAMKFLNYSVKELCEKNLTILLPLYLLRLRRETENAKKRKTQKEATLREIAKKLKELINENILPAIVESEKSRNITNSDAFELLSLLDRLYNYMYGNINEFKDEEANNMLSDILELKYDARYAEDTARFKAKLEEELEARLEARLEAKLEEERINEKITTARIMKEEGAAISMIVKVTGFSYDDVENL